MKKLFILAIAAIAIASCKKDSTDNANCGIITGKTYIQSPPPADPYGETILCIKWKDGTETCKTYDGHIENAVGTEYCP